MRSGIARRLGGAAGAVAGHAVHHGVLGAVGGCVAGHEYHKHQQREAVRKRYEQENKVTGGHPEPNASRY